MSHNMYHIMNFKEISWEIPIREKHMYKEEEEEITEACSNV